MTKPVIIIGASGHMKDVAFIIECLPSEWRFAGILDDGMEPGRQLLLNVPLLGTASSWINFEEHWFVVAIGSPRTRKNVVDSMLKQGTPQFATLIHPAANVSKLSLVGSGCMIGPGTSISVDARISDHVILNSNATVAHDDLIGAFSTIAPLAAISGNVTLEEGVEIGTGAAIRQGTRVGKGAMIGMGSVVTRDVPPNTCVIGNPARFLKELPPFGETP